jgi:hypothetical protein
MKQGMGRHCTTQAVVSSPHFSCDAAVLLFMWMLQGVHSIQSFKVFAFEASGSLLQHSHSTTQLHTLDHTRVGSKQMATRHIRRLQQQLEASKAQEDEQEASDSTADTDEEEDVEGNTAAPKPFNPFDLLDEEEEQEEEVRLLLASAIITC